MKHLAIMDEDSINAILFGKKTIETRFSSHKIAPFGAVSLGDLVYIKPPGKEIKGQFRVKKVYYFAGLEPKDVGQIFQYFGLKFDNGVEDFLPKYLKLKEKSLYASLLFIGQSERLITSPVKITKSDRRGWVVLK